MTLVLEAPPAREPERRYIVDTIMRDWLGLDCELRISERADVRVTLQGEAGPAHVTIPEGLFATDVGDWLTPASLPDAPVPWRPVTCDESALRPGERLPVLYGPRPAPPALLSGERRAVELSVDVFGSAFFMLSRYEERAVGTRDTYDRFPASASVAEREGFLRLPIVDAYVELLWSALRRVWPRLERKRRAFRVALTHDVDHPLAFLGRTLPGLARQLGADALVRRDARLAGRRLRSWTAIPRRDYRLDPYNTFDFLMAVSERHGIASAFYFLATEHNSHLDGFYTLDDPWIRSLMARIAGGDHEIGYHAGFHTYCDPDRTQREFSRLRTAANALGVEQSHWGGRQHYLRWRNPDTWCNWDRAGLSYDSTLGFAEKVGFRAGTCHEFRTFDLLRRCPLDLRERPLQVMDRTLFDYMALAPHDATEAALEVARECKRMGGTFTLLWHNSVLQTAAERRWYEELTDRVTALPA
jgi:hypothetical protein